MRVTKRYEPGEIEGILARVRAGESVEDVAASTGHSAKAMKVKLTALGWRPARHRAHGPAPVKPKGPAREPTDARPGSEEKILALSRRYLSGELLYHPDDCKGPVVRKLNSAEAYQLARREGAEREELEEDDDE